MVLQSILAHSANESVGLLAAIAEPTRSLALAASAFTMIFVYPRIVPTGPDPATDKWYQNLTKPKWQPPKWVFPAVWIPLKAMQCVSLVLLWKQVKNPKALWISTAVYFLHISLGNLWNYVFFAKQDIKMSLPVMGAFWLTCLGSEISFGLSGAVASSCLLIPTNVWATIASVLNIHTYILNKDEKKPAPSA
mmetsp:Transcript_6367/g.11499  ORF Transcript_6367/g.11499 Transcript_6367/m.11499 type:complete len:192 (-) Transcript_6367:1427-2002(-)